MGVPPAGLDPETLAGLAYLADEAERIQERRLTRAFRAALAQG